MRFTLGLVILLFSQILLAQNRETISFENTSLQEILTEVEKSYDVKFSYNTSLVEGKKITIDEKNATLNTVLQNIQRQTVLVFEKINERYYIIRDRRQEGKIKICGILRDSITDFTIADASIINKSQSKGAVSNSKGYFELFLSNPTDTIEISFLGYKTKQLIANELFQTPCATVPMISDQLSLQEVLLSDYLTSGIDKKDNGSISVSPSQLGILPGLTEPDVLQSIQLVPGIQSPTETASGLFIRGGTPDQNLILWDGIKMYHSGHFFGLISAFNPYVIEDVSIFKSGTETRYGDRIAGVIDINTTSEIPKEIHGGIGFNMTHVDGYIKAPIGEKFAVTLSARRAFTDAWETFTYNNFSERVFQNTKITEDEQIFEDVYSETDNRFYFTDYTAKIIGKLSDKDELHISNLMTRNELDYGSKIEAFEQSTRDQLSIKNSGTSATWKHQWSPKFSHAFKGYISKFDFDYLETYNSPLGPLTEEVRKRNEIEDVGFSFETLLKPTEEQEWNYGYQFSSNDISYGFSSLNFNQNTANDYDDRESGINNSHALYTSYKYNHNNKFIFNSGIRLNYFSSVKDVFIEPRLYMETRLNKFLSFTISAELKNQAATQILEFNTYNFGLENQVWALANGDDIPVLKSKQFSLGLLFNHDGWRVDVDGYYKHVRGMTSFNRSFASTSIIEPSSRGKSDIYGLDILVKKKIDNYQTWMSYSLTNNEFRFSEINGGSPFAGNYDIKHFFRWSHSYTLNNFKFSLGWNYRTGPPYTPLSSERLNNGALLVRLERTNTARLTDYHRLDFSGTYTFNFDKKKNWRGKLGFSLLNVYDRKNLLERIYELRAFVADNNQIQVELQQVDKFSLGMTPNILFRVDF